MISGVNFDMDALFNKVGNNELNNFVISAQSTTEEAITAAKILAICNRNGINTSQLIAVAQEFMDENIFRTVCVERMRMVEKRRCF